MNQAVVMQNWIGPRRKLIPRARVLIVHSDAEIGERWRADLHGFGMAGADVCHDAEEAVGLITGLRWDGVLVALTDFKQCRWLIAACAPVRRIDLPFMLVLARPTRAYLTAAAKAGFDAVLPASASSRLIYRRMGSLMQRARRVARSAAMISWPAEAIDGLDPGSM